MGAFDNKFWVKFKLLLVECLRQVLPEVLTEQKLTEVWLDNKGMTKQFGLSENWMRYNADKLPRVAVGNNKWVYPRNEIQRLFWGGKILSLTSK